MYECVWLTEKVTHSTESRICDCGRSHTRRSRTSNKAGERPPLKSRRTQKFSGTWESECVCMRLFIHSSHIYSQKSSALRAHRLNYRLRFGYLLRWAEMRPQGNNCTKLSCVVPKVPKNGSGWLWTKILGQRRSSLSMRLTSASTNAANSSRPWLKGPFCHRKSSRNGQHNLDWGVQPSIAGTRASLYLSALNAGQCCLRICSHPVCRVVGAGNALEEKISTVHGPFVIFALVVSLQIVFVGAKPDLWIIAPMCVLALETKTA